MLTCLVSIAKIDVKWKLSGKVFWITSFYRRVVGNYREIMKL